MLTLIYEINKTIYIGRKKFCDIVLFYPTISGIHCKIIYNKDELFIEDLRSKKGTFLNGKKVVKERLKSGDLIQIGEILLKIEKEYQKWFLKFYKHIGENNSYSIDDFIYKIFKEYNFDICLIFESDGTNFSLKYRFPHNESFLPPQQLLKEIYEIKEKIGFINKSPLISFNFLIYKIKRERTETFVMFGFSDMKNKALLEKSLLNVLENKEKILLASYEGDTETLQIPTLKEKEENYELEDQIIGISEKIIKTKEFALKAALSDFPVLLIGESGTGKELFARLIHYNSKRAKGPFIVVNCPAIPINLAESELFGYEKGSFTDARERKLGKIEIANNGTLFLDQIESIPLEIQAKLLRFMENKTFERIGGNDVLYSDVRIIAATNVKPEKLILDGVLREDFYFRLAYLIIELPPLRERKEDIPHLCKYFLQKHRDSFLKEITGLKEDALNFLLSLPYKGNVRELKNLICRAATLAKGEQIELNDLKEALSSKESNSDILPRILSLKYREAKKLFEKYYIEKILEKTGWNISEASKISGISRKAIYNILKKK